MIILHLSMLDNRFVLWGERSVDQPIAKRRGRPAKEKNVRMSPYDAGACLLSDICSEEVLGMAPELRVSFHTKKPFIAQAWLPSDIPSHPASLPASSTRSYGE